MFMKIHELNCEHWQIFHQSIQFVGNLSQNHKEIMIVILVENYPLN